MITAIVIGVLALIFILQNTDRGKVKFWFWDISAPAWIWLVVLFGAGRRHRLAVPLAAPQEHEQGMT